MVAADRKPVFFRLWNERAQQVFGKCAASSPNRKWASLALLFFLQEEDFFDIDYDNDNNITNSTENSDKDEELTPEDLLLPW